MATALALGCSGTSRPSVRTASGPVARSIEQAAISNGLPRDLVLAIAAVEGGLLLPRFRQVRSEDEVPVGGALELRHGVFNSLARGATLIGASEDALRQDTELGTIAGALVLAELAAQTHADFDDVASYRRALEVLSGMSSEAARQEYATRVLEVVRRGGTFPARDGEWVTVDRHPEMAPAEVGARQQALAGSPDAPGAIWFQTACTNKCNAGRGDGNSSVNTIVIHDTEGGWDASVATLQNDSGKSVHYIVDADGSRVGQFLHETDTAWHAGNRSVNWHSIGIEHVGFASDKSGYADGQYQASVKLVQNIRTRWTVPLDRAHIFGHYQVPNGSTIAESSPPCSATLASCEADVNYGGSGNHRDPGFHWMWCQYFERLGGTCACNDAYPLWNCTTDLTEAVRCKTGKVEIDHCGGGCRSMPTGSDDVCVHAPGDDGGAGANDGGNGAGPGTPGANPDGGGDAAAPSPGGAGPGHLPDSGDNPPDSAGHRNSSGGCAIAIRDQPTPSWPLWLLVGSTLLLAMRSSVLRRTRPAAAPACAQSLSPLPKDCPSGPPAPPATGSASA